jgi:L-iditol 2-dehydrogenase
VAENPAGADVVIVAAPAHSAQESALHLAGVGGRILFFGGLPKDRPSIAFDSNLVHYKELVVTGTTACSTSDCLRATGIVNSGRMDLSDVVSHRFPLAAVADAFAAAESRIWSSRNREGPAAEGRQVMTADPIHPPSSRS